MRLYVADEYGHKTYISSAAQHRLELPQYFIIRCALCGEEKQFHRNDVIAEPATGATVGGAIVGGLVGLLGGPLGLILGGLAGGLVGTNSDNADIQRAKRFNDEYAP